jgi:predicted kinase
LEGYSAIVDAVYAGPTDRRAIEAVAVNVSAPFVGIWLDAPEQTLIKRVVQRTNDPSDADARVIQMQRTEDAGEIDWRRLDASLPTEGVLRNAVRYLNERVGASLSASSGEEH